MAWIEAECEAMRDRGELAVDLPPCLFPYILPHHADWRPRYERYNRPGDYHNGGVWPFVCGFYVAACVAAGRMDLARAEALGADRTGQAVARKRRRSGVSTSGFRRKPVKPSGRDWQTWSAAMYLYAAECVQQQRTPFFDEMRAGNPVA